MQINATNLTAEHNPQLRQKKETVVSPQTDSSNVESSSHRSPEKFDKQENLDKLKEILGENNITLKFRRDEETKAVVVELVDNTTGEAIRQIPSEISLKLATAFVKLQGQFLDKSE